MPTDTRHTIQSENARKAERDKYTKHGGHYAMILNVYILAPFLK